MKCVVVSGTKTASKNIGFIYFLDSWARTKNIKLYKGTLNLKPSERFILPGKYEMLPGRFERETSYAEQIDGYSPRIYEVVLNGFKCWSFAWSEGKARKCFEVISNVRLRDKFNLKDGDLVDLEFIE